jgi:hypothetical protein
MTPAVFLSILSINDILFEFNRVMAFFFSRILSLSRIVLICRRHTPGRNTCFVIGGRSNYPIAEWNSFFLAMVTMCFDRQKHTHTHRLLVTIFFLLFLCMIIGHTRYSIEPMHWLYASIIVGMDRVGDEHHGDLAAYGEDSDAEERNLKEMFAFLI